MKVTLVGVQEFNFKTDDGSTIDGVKLHFLAADENVYGHLAEKIFVSRNVFNSFRLHLQDVYDSVDQVIDLEFNQRRKICGINLLKESA